MPLSVYCCSVSEVLSSFGDMTSNGLSWVGIPDDFESGWVCLEPFLTLFHSLVLLLVDFGLVSSHGFVVLVCFMVMMSVDMFVVVLSVIFVSSFSFCKQ